MGCLQYQFFKRRRSFFYLMALEAIDGRSCVVID